MDNYDSYSIHKLTEAILANYEEEKLIIKIESRDQINSGVIREIMENLRSLIYPGFFGQKRLKRDSIEYFVGELLENLTYHLNKQITRAVLNDQNDESSAERAASRITSVFLSQVPALRGLLAADVEASHEGDPAAFSTDEIIWSYPGIYAITIYRLAHELYKLGVPRIPRMMTEFAHSHTGIDINPGATIGHHFFIDHGTGIVIGETTVIGNFVKIYQGVTLGAMSTRGGQALKGVKRHPTIEDHVTIYSGASILGGATVIGEGVVIGSNAFITKSVPEKTRVSVKDPELQFKGDSAKRSVEFNQDEFWDYMI
ncbi:MAG: serine O-acetyltransferase [Synergistaceae bacterium]|jgi:serine O-acetyltransferase|nr:serine O-acetyltransferase [Synergistaceae bacterium]